MKSHTGGQPQVELRLANWPWRKGKAAGQKDGVIGQGEQCPRSDPIGIQRGQNVPAPQFFQQHLSQPGLSLCKPSSEGGQLLLRPSATLHWISSRDLHIPSFGACLPSTQPPPCLG